MPEHAPLTCEARVKRNMTLTHSSSCTCCVCICGNGIYPGRWENIAFDDLLHFWRENLFISGSSVDLFPICSFASRMPYSSFRSTKDGLHVSAERIFLSQSLSHTLASFSSIIVNGRNIAKYGIYGPDKLLRKIPCKRCDQHIFHSKMCRIWRMKTLLCVCVCESVWRRSIWNRIECRQFSCVFGELIFKWPMSILRNTVCMQNANKYSVLFWETDLQCTTRSIQVVATIGWEGVRADRVSERESQHKTM